MTDAEFDKCMKDIAKGNHDALRVIYDAYLKLVFAIMFDTIKQREEAEDLTSEFFIKLYKIADSYKPGNGHKRWIATIAKNMAIDLIRKRDREALCDEMPEPNGGLGTPDISDSVVDNITADEALSTLSQGEREILDLKVVGGFTFKEISEMLNRPMGTVTWCYNNAIKKLRRCKNWLWIIIIMIEMGK